MRSIAIGLLILPLAGCSLELLATTAIQGTLQAESASALMKQKAYAENAMARTNIERGIGMYAAETGMYPASLQVLVPDFMTRIPPHADGTPFGYDPSTGELLDAPMVAPMSREDQANLSMLRDAVGNYAQTSGYFPASLQELAPFYMTFVPVTASGQAFIYNGHDGSVTHPATLAAPRPVRYGRPGTAGVGGAGPIGELMTGIAIQQELGNMGNASSAKVGSRARYQIETIQTGANKTHEEMLDELGL